MKVRRTHHDPNHRGNDAKSRPTDKAHSNYRPAVVVRLNSPLPSKVGNLAMLLAMRRADQADHEEAPARGEPGLGSLE